MGYDWNEEEEINEEHVSREPQERERDWWSVSEVARLLDVGGSTVRCWWRKGLLRGYCLPSTGEGDKSTIRFEKEDVVAFVRKEYTGWTDSLVSRLVDRVVSKEVL